MGYRLKTSKETKDIFESLGNRTNLKPFALSKLAIALSLREEEPIEECETMDTDGLELNRQTIMAQYDSVFKCLMEQNVGRHLTDDEYFPDYTKKHLDRGAKLLIDLYNYKGNFEKLFNSLLKDEDYI